MIRYSRLSAFVITLKQLQARQILREHLGYTTEHLIAGTLQDFHHRTQLLQAAAVDRHTLDPVFLESLGDPDAELGSSG